MENNAEVEEINTFRIPIEELFPKFEEHLNIKNNRRVLVSGKFGIGKTYFLNEFFKNKKDKYESYHLFPINYQISINENIIEFLKYDILVETIKKNEGIFTKEDYSNFFDLQRLLYIWGQNNFQKIFDTGISLIPKLGRPLREISELIKNFWEFKERIEKGEKGNIEEFLKKINKKKATETDYLSEIIKQKIKEQKDEKESLLVLDDLDRIDPEHIFRILNVFSAHFDLQNNEELPNKFGFDKVIIVADFSNFRSIFHHKYGRHTDSSGYFSKFFSVEVFKFKNEELVARTIDQIISKFQIEDTQNLKEAIGPNGFIRIILEDILKRSLKLTGEEKLNMWQLLKGVRFSLSAFKPGKYKKGFIYGKEQAIPQFIKISIHALISIFNGLDSDLALVLKKIKKNLKNEEKERIYNLFSFYLLKEIKDFKKDINSEGKILWEQYEIKINLGRQKIENIITKQNSDTSLLAAELFYDLLIEYINQDLHNKEIRFFSLCSTKLLTQYTLFFFLVIIIGLDFQYVL